MITSRIAARILLALGSTVSLGPAASGCGDAVPAETDDQHAIHPAGGDATADAGAEAALDALVEALGEAPLEAVDAALADVSPDYVPPCPRRPFLVGDEPRAAEACARADWGLSSGNAWGLDEATRAALAFAWREDGRREHASVAAFARFTMLMVGAGAPPELVAASQRASIDEIRHARACFALAGRYAGAPVGPGDLDVAGSVERASLEELAVLTVHEGCVGETIGVLLASAQHAGTGDREARRALARIVTDELRHTELAWRFVAWAIERGGEPVRGAVARAFVAASRASLATVATAEPRVDLALWHHHGRITVAETRDVVARAIGEIVAPCARGLFARNPADARGPYLPSDSSGGLDVESTRVPHLPSAPKVGAEA